MCPFARAYKLRYDASLSCGSVRLASKLRIRRTTGAIPRIESFGYRETSREQLGGECPAEDSEDIEQGPDVQASKVSEADHWGILAQYSKRRRWKVNMYRGNEKSAELLTNDSRDETRRDLQRCSNGQICRRLSNITWKRAAWRTCM